jgi:hypothetical protein
MEHMVPDRHVTEQSLRTNTAYQVRMSILTLGLLLKAGIEPGRLLKVEFFYFTDAREKAEAFVRSLTKIDYDAKARASTKHPGRWLVEGWTTPIPMDEETVVQWTQEMCEAGFMHDCEFDGWGTDPKQ